MARLLLLQLLLTACTLLLPRDVHATARRPRTFGKGIPNHPFTDVEVEIFNHSLAAGSSSGMVTHFWSTACGAGVSFKGALDSGITTYRYYLDGETVASVVFTPREAAGVVFDPIGECDHPGCTHPAPGSGGGGGPTPAGGTHPGNRSDEYIIGGRGATCDAACAESGNRVCNAQLNPAGVPQAELGAMMADLVEYDTGAKCVVDTVPWWAPDQPSYVWAANNSNYLRCLGSHGVPEHTFCNGSHPLVQRLCRCGGGGTNPAKSEHMADYRGQDLAPGPSGMDLVSAKVPWGTEWIGKTSDMDGYYTNLRVPFYKSIRVTAQLPKGHAGFSVCAALCDSTLLCLCERVLCWILYILNPRTLPVDTIIRGQENVPLTIGGLDLTSERPRLRQYVNRNLSVPSLGFTPLVNLSSGAGVIWAHTLGIEGNPRFTYLEGCFHLITPYIRPINSSNSFATLGISANWPGVTLSTGMEDYYDSSFYFHAGIFQLPVSGVTHMCAGGGRSDAPHPACPPEPGQSAPPPNSRWSGYRFHEQDPLWFEDGVQLLVRNGDVGGPVPCAPS